MRLRGVLFVSIALLLAGCSEEKPKPKAAEKPAEAVTGRYAFYQAYRDARMWAGDVQGYRIASIPISEVPAQPGKSGAWEITFVSPSKGAMRSFTYSVAEVGGNLHKGVFGSREEPLPSGPDASGWPVAALKIDSDEAYKTALEKTAAEVKKIGETPMFYLAEQNKRFSDLTWRVVWGPSVSAGKFSVFVDASTGQFLERGR